MSQVIKKKFTANNLKYLHVLYTKYTLLCTEILKREKKKGGGDEYK